MVRHSTTKVVRTLWGLWRRSPPKCCRGAWSGGRQPQGHGREPSGKRRSYPEVPYVLCLRPGPNNRRFWGLSGTLLSQNQLEKVGGRGRLNPNIDDVRWPDLKNMTSGTSGSGAFRNNTPRVQTPKMARFPTLNKFKVRSQSTATFRNAPRVHET